ncbi:MAG: sigma-70 family RNA polymerase sigma factor [Planctomycetes bacterium]|nr:sigma-70 family RNA polymerase sigma factor [Planctomycetota bacterium]
MDTTGSSDVGAERPVPEATPVAPAGSSLTPTEFEEMTAAVADRLFATALRLARNRADAEDVVQDTMLRAWRALGSFQRGTRFEAWIFRILHNAFLNRRRKESLAPEVRDPDTFSPPDRGEVVPDVRSLGELPALADRHFDDRVKAAIDELPDVYRTPFLLFAMADLTYEEIASAQGVPIGTVMSRLHRARAHLKARLASYARDQGHPGGRT